MSIFSWTLIESEILFFFFRCSAKCKKFPKPIYDDDDDGDYVYRLKSESNDDGFENVDLRINPNELEKKKI